MLSMPGFRWGVVDGLRSLYFMSGRGVEVVFADLLAWQREMSAFSGSMVGRDVRSREKNELIVSG